LVDTKANDNRTLLQYLAELVDKRFPKLAAIVDDVESAGAASRVSITTIKHDCGALHHSSTVFIGDMERIRRSAEQLGEESRLFWESASPFLVRAKELAEQLDRDVENTWAAFQDLLRYFGEDPNEMTSESFFGIFRTFAVSFRKALQFVRENENLAHPADSRKTSGIESKATGEEPSVKPVVANTKITTTSENDRGVMDSLIESLKNGHAPNVMKNLPEVPPLATTREPPRKPLSSHGGHELLYRRSSLGHYTQQAMNLLETIKSEE
jgi:hypothetical protein